MTTPETPARETSLFAKSLKTLVQTFKDTPRSEFEEESKSELSLDEITDLLRQQRRRAIVERLAETNQRRISVSELAEDIACAECGCTPAGLGSAERKRVYVALLQSHLPRLDRADVVAYDRDAKLVSRGPQFDRLWRAYTALRDAVS